MYTLGLFSYGGVEEMTVDALLREIFHAGQQGINLKYHRISGDALIDRSRSRALGNFYADKESSVMVMVDHDIHWRPGDLVHIAQKAEKENALVGGLYCKRAFHKGWASRVDTAQGKVFFGQDSLLPTECLATGFLAIPRTVVQGIIDEFHIDSPKFKEKWQKAVDDKDLAQIALLRDLSIARIVDGAYREPEYDYCDFFRCFRWASGINTDTYQYLSEDWAFSMRATHAGFKSYISTYPILIHYGTHGFQVQDGMDAKDRALAHEAGNVQNNQGPNQGTGRATDKLRKRLKSRH
jgi:hypothetical protein